MGSSVRHSNSRWVASDGCSDEEWGVMRETAGPAAPPRLRDAHRPADTAGRAPGHRGRAAGRVRRGRHRAHPAALPPRARRQRSAVYRTTSPARKQPHDNPAVARAHRLVRRAGGALRASAGARARPAVQARSWLPRLGRRVVCFGLDTAIVAAAASCSVQVTSRGGRQVTPGSSRPAVAGLAAINNHRQ